MVLMRVAPFRTFVHRDFERADFADKRCYMTARAAAISCCSVRATPRRAIASSGATIQRCTVLGIVENVFKG